MAKKDKKVNETKRTILAQLFENPWIVLLIYFTITLVMLWRSLFSGHMTGGSDFLSTGYMNRFFLARHGFHLWQPYTFSGIPTVDAFFGDILYPVTIVLRQIFTPHLIPLLLYLIHLPLSGLFTYLFIKDQKIRAPIAFLSGLCYMLAGCIVSLINAGQDGRLMVNCLLPGVIFFINRGYDRRKFFYFIMTGIFFGLAVLSPHVQMAYYLALASIFFVIFKTINGWQKSGFKSILKPGLSYLLSAMIGLILAACLILPVFYYIKFSARGGRGYAWATSWAMPPEEILNLITPHFSGLLDNYWGRNYFKLHTEYLGILPLLLSLYAFIRAWKNPLTKFFTGLAVFALVFAWGGHTPIYWLFYKFLPYVSKTRAPSQIFYLFSFAIAVLAGIGGEKLFNSDNKKTNLFFYLAAGSFVLWLFANLFAQGIMNVLAPLAHAKTRILTSNYHNFQTGLFILFIIIAIYAALASAVIRKKLSLRNFALLAGIVFFFDMWRIEKNFIPVVASPDRYFAADEVVRALSEDRSLYRVHPLAYRQGNYLMLFDIQSVGGEHGNHLMRYQEFIGAQHSIMFEPTNLYYPNILNLLNVKYIIMPNFDLSDIPDYSPNPTDDAMIKTIRLVTNPLYFKLFYQGRQFSIYQNLYCLPRAFLVPQYRVVTDKNQIMVTMKSSAFNPQQQVILEEDPASFMASDTASPGRADVIDYQPDRVGIEVRALHPCFLVLTDNYYPLWQAEVDGKQTRVYRADYTFRAVYVTTGQHKVTFRFVSPYFKLGTLFSLLTALVAGLTIFFLARKKYY